jgi:hypothetical protein
MIIPFAVENLENDHQWVDKVRNPRMIASIKI